MVGAVDRVQATKLGGRRSRPANARLGQRHTTAGRPRRPATAPSIRTTPMPRPAQSERASNQPRRATNRMSGGHVAIAAIGAFAISLLGLIVLRLSVSGEIYPNVAVYDVNVGGLSRGKAERRLQ